MHDYHKAVDMVNFAKEKAEQLGKSKVTKINIVVGESSGYSADSICMAHFEDSEVELSKNELRILRLLMCNKDRIISRDEIMNDLWQSEEFVDDNTLTVNINRLRKKLDGIGVHDYLATKRGQGYLV